MVERTPLPPGPSGPFCPSAESDQAGPERICLSVEALLITGVNVSPHGSVLRNGDLLFGDLHQRLQQLAAHQQFTCLTVTEMVELTVLALRTSIISVRSSRSEHDVPTPVTLTRLHNYLHSSIGEMKARKLKRRQAPERHAESRRQPKGGVSNSTRGT